VSTQPINDELHPLHIRSRLMAHAALYPDAIFHLRPEDRDTLLAALVAVRAECDRLVTVKEAAEQVIRDYPPHEYGCEWSEYSPSFGALREALAAVSGESQGASDSSPGEEQKTEVGGRQKPPVDDLRELIECFCPNGDHRPGCPHV
jgi:hypothetical protein